MTDKEQAIQDALQAILKARTPRQTGRPQLPPGDIDLPIDPDLLDPTPLDQPEQNDNIDLDDPDNLLRTKQQNQKAKQSNGQDKGQDNGQDKGHHQISDEFAAAWNEIIDKYDNDDITDTQLRTLLTQIQAGIITEL